MKTEQKKPNQKRIIDRLLAQVANLQDQLRARPAPAPEATMPFDEVTAYQAGLQQGRREVAATVELLRQQIEALATEREPHDPACLCHPAHGLCSCEPPTE